MEVREGTFIIDRFGWHWQSSDDEEELTNS